MASSRLPSVLDTDFQSQEAAREKANSDGGAALDLPDGCRESNLGCATNSWRPCRGFLLRLPLRFEKQVWSIEDAFADCGCPLAPRGIQLAGLARIAVLFGEDGGHPLAVLQALACHWHQKLHRHLRQNLALAYLLLDRFRQNLRQRQSPRYPAHTAIEPPRQLIQPIVEAPLQLRQ